MPDAIRFGKRDRTYDRGGKPRRVWIAWLDRGRDDYGKRQREQHEFPTKQERDDWLASALAGDRVARRTKRASGPTVGDALEAWYSENTALGRWSPTHRATTRRLIDGDLASIAPVALSRVTVQHAQDLVNSMVAAGRSPFTVGKARKALSAALNAAIRRRELPVGYNVAQLAQVPAIPKPEPTFLSAEDVPRFLDLVEHDPLGPLFTVSVALGLRPSEAIGLRWADVDLDRGTLTVRRSTQHDRGKVVERGTKTGRERTVPLPDSITGLLLAHRGRQTVRAIDGRVFVNTTGGALHQPTVARHLRHMLERENVRAKAAGERLLPMVTQYELRHTAATLMLTLGVPLEHVQEVLGHSTIVTTRRYAQVVEDRLRASADRMDSVFRGARGGTSGGTTAG